MASRTKARAERRSAFQLSSRVIPDPEVVCRCLAECGQECEGLNANDREDYGLFAPFLEPARLYGGRKHNDRSGRSGMRRGCTWLAGLTLAACATVPPSPAPADVTIDGSRVYPESITSDAAGNLYNVSHGGTIYRALAGAKTA